MSEFTEINDISFQETLTATEAGIILFYKNLCPHCKNMEKVLAKFSIKSRDTAIMTIDSEACPLAMTITKVERVPTLVIVKAGKIVANKVGLMNPKELLALYASV